MPPATSAAHEQPVESVDQLEGTFADGCKPPADWTIGVEYEKPVVDRDSGESVPYEGDRGIGRLLRCMAENDPRWKPVYEADSVIALRDGRASITLEPGGQLEMSGEQCASLFCADEELRGHVAEIVAAGAEIGQRFLALGAVPKTPLAAAPWMPKGRYRIMRDVMLDKGSLGRSMMQQTATVQSNFDYADEADARLKMRVGYAISPLLVALSANSPVVDGRASGFRSYRAHVWSDTDPDRCGYLPFVFDSDSLFAAYTDYALDVPMYFIARGDRLVTVERKTFRSFMTDGHDGERATMADWNLHLTTLFPEVRLKTYIEVRAADSQPIDLMLGTPALMKGLFYDSDALAAAWDELRRLPLDRLGDLHESAARDGMQVRLGRHTARDIAIELLAIAREGLVRQAVAGPDGGDESRFLDPLIEQAEAGRCPADRLIELWEGPWAGNVDRLVEYAAYSEESTHKH